jgi:hypothetical protein
MPIRQSEPSGSTPPPAGMAAPAASPVHGGVPGAAAAASGTGQTPRTGQRETFTSDELAIVLSNFDIGVIESITEYPRGSRKAPKVLIASEQGKFLLNATGARQGRRV